MNRRVLSPGTWRAMGTLDVASKDSDQADVQACLWKTRLDSFSRYGTIVR
jgi:hypothetical protein